MILRARVVVPVCKPPIANGAVLLSGRRIGAVGRWRELRSAHSGPVIDLGESALMPGLVNAHCHLDYTHMAGHLPPPQVFTDWLKQITELKAGWTLAEYARSWSEGAEMLLRSGTTTVADIEAMPELLPRIWLSTPLRVLSFLELIGIGVRRPAAGVLEEALQNCAQIANALSGKEPVSARMLRERLGLSPHATYSTIPELLHQVAQTSARRGWRVCTHVAESRLEMDMFAQGQGAMFDWMQKSGRNMSDCGLGSPVQHLERHGFLSKRLLVAHVNYLGRGDARLLARRRVSVVHCPRSHFYFKHHPFPLQRLVRAGVNVCLGTDSLASVYQRRHQTVELNMFEEMRVLAHHQPWLTARGILRMATAGGARALGLAGVRGELARGAAADLISIPLAGSTGNVYERLLSHQGPVAASMIAGAWAIPPAS